MKGEYNSKLRLYFFFRLAIANVIRKVRVFYLRIRGFDVQYSSIVERSVKLDKLFPKGIHIGKNSLIAGEVLILSHDHCKRVGNNQPYITHTYIGDNCFIAMRSIILPGVKIGNEVIVGAGSVVTKNIPSNCVAVGNPARIIKRNIKMNDFAALENWTEDQGWIEL